ncbi:MAG TPA: HAD hydrolase-like protein [Pedobacter sp.]|nr:HAD hydrolase-like protein [Pedobacter sp.]
MAFENHLQNKQAFVFELDDVIYPEKDYLLQVYYLFAQFMEYGEQMDAGALVKSMQNTYFNDGPKNVFDKTSRLFNIPEKYKLNFDLLMISARLPLKLLIFNEVLKFIQEVVMERKHIFIFTNGDPGMQLNKIRQIEWHGLESYLEVHFAAESASKPSAKGLQAILNKHNLKKTNVLMIGTSELDSKCAKNAGVDFLPADKLLKP